MTLFVILQITVRLTLKMDYAAHEVHSRICALCCKTICAKMKGKAKTCLKAAEVNPSTKSVIMKSTICKGSENVIKESLQKKKPKTQSKSGSQCANVRRIPASDGYKYISHNVVCDLLSLIG
uniref:Uncharacterized protein n=1 Tax=Wuchereria bancrofti TaxID=6293 RepID=A0AAF5PHH2_WUCBA